MVQRKGEADGLEIIPCLLICTNAFQSQFFFKKKINLFLCLYLKNSHLFVKKKKTYYHCYSLPLFQISSRAPPQIPHHPSILPSHAHPLPSAQHLRAGIPRRGDEQGCGLAWLLLLGCGFGEGCQDARKHDVRGLGRIDGTVNALFPVVRHKRSGLSVVGLQAGLQGFLVVI